MNSDITVLTEVISLQNKTIKQQDAFITDLEKNIQKIKNTYKSKINKLEKIIQQKDTIYKHLENNFNIINDTSEVNKLREQVDSLIKFISNKNDINYKDLPDMNNKSYTTTDNKLSIKNDWRHTISDRINNNINLGRTTNIPAPQNMTLIDELKVKLKNSKYEYEIDN